jgi:glycerol-3-phosphate dehydrogenase
MGFSAQLDALQQRAAAAKAAARAGRRRRARSKWAQMKADAADAIDYAAWAVDNVRLVVLDAIHARAYADEPAKAAGASPAPRSVGMTRHGPRYDRPRRRGLLRR